MALRDELLTPIAGANPGGVELRYDPLFDKVKDALHEDDPSIPREPHEGPPRKADWPTVIRLTKDALATKTKDLQLAAWLTEALLRREGIAGLRDGLDLLAGLVEQFWDSLYPEIDDGDAEMRAAPLGYIATRLDLPVRRVAVDKTGNTLLQYKEAQTLPTEAAAADDTEIAAKRQAMIDEGKTTPETINAGFAATPKAWYRALIADTEAAVASIKALNAVAGDKFGDLSPNFTRLTEAVEDVQRTVSAQLKKKLEIDPDPIEVPAAPDLMAGGASAVSTGAAGAGSGPLAPEPVSRDDAASRIIGAARYLRRDRPTDPSPYLMLRGFRWGELRTSGALDPKLLEAPPTHVRTALRGMLLDARWPDLLEACEGVMGTPQGRGWIDLQRYAVTACDSLGSDYDAVATALRGALRSLLSDLPQLLDMALMDDTPTANAETRNWLRDILRAPDSMAVSGGTPVDGLLAVTDEEPRARDPISLAKADVRAGNINRAIALLKREASREETQRGRFLLQSEAARIMIDAGHYPVAMPILNELIEAIDAHKLEDWEIGTMVATPLALLYTALERTGADEGTRESLYLRICQLDPVGAISLRQA